MNHPTLIENLRAMSRHEHDDLSIGADAADEITALVQCLRSLGDFADHRKNCPVYRYGLTSVVGQQVPQCTCGYSEIAEGITGRIMELGL